MCVVFHSPTPTTAAVDRCSPRHRPSSARRTSSPARCLALGKPTPASGKSSPAASPLVDSSRRRQATDYRSSPRHAAVSSVGGSSPRHATMSSVGGVNSSPGGLGIRGQSSANRHSVRCDGDQSASSLSAAVTDGRQKATVSEEHAAIHSETHPESQLKPHIVGMQRSTNDKNSNSHQCSSQPANTTTTDTTTTTTTTTTTAAAAAAAADDDVKSRCTEQSLATDTNCTSQVHVQHVDRLR